jgi:GTPase
MCKTGEQNQEIKHSFSIDMPNKFGHGNIEYNMNLLDSSIPVIEKHAKRMKFRLNEGNGECIYEIGIDDDGNALGLSEEDLKISISSVYSISEKLHARVKAINFYQGKKGTVAEVYIKKSEVPITSIEIKIGIIGEERSGRSTLVKI